MTGATYLVLLEVEFKEVNILILLEGATKEILTLMQNKLVVAGARRPPVAGMTIRGSRH